MKVEFGTDWKHWLFWIDWDTWPIDDGPCFFFCLHAGPFWIMLSKQFYRTAPLVEMGIRD